MEEDVLRKIGLTGNEAAVYTALLELGSSLAGEIAKKTGLNRSHIYDTLRRLSDKGLAAHVIKNNRRYFKAAEPMRILQYLEEREAELKAEREEAKRALPALVELSKLPRTRAQANIYEGKEGLKTICEQLLRSGEGEWLSLSSSGAALEVLPHYIPKFHERRIENKISLKILEIDEAMGRRRGSELSAMPKTKVRYVPSSLVSPASIWIWGGSVAFMVWPSQIGIVIEDRQTAQTFKAYFEAFWRTARKQ